MRTLKYSTLLAIAMQAVGCASVLADRHFQTPDEVAAMKNAKWVAITANAKNKTVYYDPYAITWMSENVFKVPVSFPMSSGTYGAWLVELNCDNASGRVMKTLGARYESPNPSFNSASGSVYIGIRDRICGITLGPKNYAFVAPDKTGNIYYYDQRSIARNVKDPAVYRFDWILFDPRTKRNLQSKTSEVNCSNGSFKLSSDQPWQRTTPMTPEDIFAARFCPTVYARHLPISSYSTASENIDMNSYMKKLNAADKQSAPAKAKTNEGQSTAKSGFDWDKLVIQPKD